MKTENVCYEISMKYINDYNLFTIIKTLNDFCCVFEKFFWTYSVT